MANVNNQTLYSVGVGDFIAYENGQLVAMGKYDTETNMEFTASYLDIRAGKRGKLVARYAHSSNATFSIIAANYSPVIYKSSMGGTQDPNGGCVPMEESKGMEGRIVSLSKDPVARGEIPATVWVKYDGEMYGALTATGTAGNYQITIPNNTDGANWSAIPDNANVCLIYMYRNLAAETIIMPAEVNPSIWHIWVDIDLVADKSGSGKVGRQVIEIPLAQLSPEQTINATMDGYSQSKVTGVMLADKSNSTNACGGQGVYAYITTEIFGKQWYEDIFAITNDVDDVTVVGGNTVALSLIGLQNGGNYMFLGTDYYDGGTETNGYIHLTLNAGASGATLDAETGVITTVAVGSETTITVDVKVTGTTIPTYTLEINITPAA